MTDQANHSGAAPDISGGDRHAQVFPSLSEAQFEVMRRYGERRSVAAGTVLFRQGERHVSMYVILQGQVEVTRTSALESHAVAVHGPGNFSGEVGTLAGRAAIGTGRALTDCDLIEIDEDSLRTLVVAEAELSETIMRAFILRRVAFINDEHGSLIVFGSRQSADTLRLRDFLIRNGQPLAYFDIDEHEETAALLQRFGVGRADVPVVVTAEGVVLKNPSNRAVADAVGLSPDSLEGKTFDLVVVGAGPGGLAAAVYAASEGLSVAVLDSKAPGGQAGSSSKIENYFGFPTGISGRALAGRGLTQARKFGAEVAVPVGVTSMDCGQPQVGYILGLDNGERVTARAVIIATGARYRKPELEGLERYEGRGVYYSASFMEGTFCSNEDIIIVGGGNSAGQAAVFLSRYARSVRIVVRADGLAASMSHYLIQRIEAAPNIELHSHTRVVGLSGEDRLERVLCQRQDAQPEELAVRHLFLFLGAEPNTEWLDECLALDEAKFVLTGPQVPSTAWHGNRAPDFLETSLPGVFAVGDVRSGSVKRVAAAVGEGAAAVQSLHSFLANTVWEPSAAQPDGSAAAPAQSPDRPDS